MSEFLEKPVHLTAIAIVASGLLLGACSTETNHDTVAPSTTTTDKEHTDQKNGPKTFEPKFSESAGHLSPIISSETLGVDGADDINPTKYIEGKGESGGNKYMPLLRIELAEGTLQMKDSSPNGVEPNLLSWFSTQFADQGTLIHAALKSGALKSVVVGLMDDKMTNPKFSAQIGNMDGFYDEKQNDAVLAISHNMSTIEAEQFKEALDHEIVHSLLSKFDFSYFSSDMISEQSQKDFIDACHSLRDTALLQASQHLEIMVAQLHELANSVHSDPEWKQSVLVLADDISNAGIMQFQPEHEKDILPLKNAVNEKLPQCYIQDIFRMRYMAEIQAGLTPKTTTEGSDTLIEEIGGKLEDIQNSYSDLLRKKTIYRSLTDETYTNMKAWGHPFDGADELGASSMSILLNYPRQLGANVRVLPIDQQQAIVSTLRLFQDQIIQKYPELSGLLSDREAEFLDAMHN